MVNERCSITNSHLRKETLFLRGNTGRTTKGEKSVVKKVTTYQEDLVNALKDSREAAAYLNAAIEEGDRAVFLLALRNVAEAQGGMAALARKTRMNRESLYRMLSSKGNPEIRSILTLLNSMELRLIVEPKTNRDKRYKRRIGSPPSLAL
jgi:probable addiction module antidote protein